MREFGNKVEFYPHYVLWQCDECQLLDWETKNERCISGGRYCDPEPFISKTIFTSVFISKETKLSGANGVVENLRQICHRNLANKTTVDDEWWRYVVTFGKKCINQNKKDLGQCRMEVYEELNIDREKYLLIEREMRQSFIYYNYGNKFEKAREENTVLNEELRLKEEMHVDHYPALYVNKERYIVLF